MLDRFFKVIDATVLVVKKAMKDENEWSNARILLAQVVRAEPPEKELLYQLSAYINVFNISRDILKSSLARDEISRSKKSLRDVYEALGNISKTYYFLTGKESRFVKMFNGYFSEITDYILEEKLKIAFDYYIAKEKHISDMVEVMRFYKEPYKQFFAELNYAFDAINSKSPSAITHLEYAKQMLDKMIKALEEF